MSSAAAPHNDVIAPTIPPPSPPATPEPASVEDVWWKHFVAGNMGGIFGLVLAYPLDTVKVRMQTRPRGTYAGILDCLSTMARTEGLTSLYRGMTSPVIGYGLIKSTAFGSYNQCKSFLLSRQPPDPAKRTLHAQLSLAQLTLCGAYAGLVQTFIRCPVEQIKVVMQARNKAGSTTAAPYSSTWACIGDVLRTEGVLKGFYRSFVPTLSREIPQYAIYYPTYELTRHLLLRPGQSLNDLSPLYTAFAGGCAGVAQWVPTYALDVVKSRVSAAPPGRYRGFVHAAVDIYRVEGISVYWRGLSAAVLRAFPLHGAVFLGYELTMKLLR